MVNFFFRSLTNEGYFMYLKTISCFIFLFSKNKQATPQQYNNTGKKFLPKIVVKKVVNKNSQTSMYSAEKKSNQNAIPETKH